MDSINYARRLQNAMMPTANDINSLVKEHFVLNMPKSIVGGDFYLVDPFLTNSNKKLTAIALADCTGHGVPGALLSSLSVGLLKNALADKSICLAGEVLDALREKISNVFRSEDPNEIIRDGMDMSLCILDPQTNILQFAGANQKGLVIKHDRTVIELLPDNQHIGYDETNATFSTNFIQLSEGDTIYLFSDGFRDQFGGENGKKLQYKNFVNKLLEINQHDLSQQRLLLQNFFNDWKKDLSQTDDVLVLGVKI
jgi:serine phosphatase RsbU (regulator of sigma subunit)